MAALFGRNLVNSGSFETAGAGPAPSGWTISGAGRLDRTEGRAGEGTGNFAFGADTTNHGGTIPQSLATVAGKTYTLTFTATSAQTTLRFTDTSPNGQADFDVGLDAVSVTDAAPYDDVGEWGDLKPWPIHGVMLDHGRLLTFGTDPSCVPGSSGHGYALACGKSSSGRHDRRPPRRNA